MDKTFKDDLAHANDTTGTKKSKPAVKLNRKLMRELVFKEKNFGKQDRDFFKKVQRKRSIRRANG